VKSVGLTAQVDNYVHRLRMLGLGKMPQMGGLSSRAWFSPSLKARSLGQGVGSIGSPMLQRESVPVLSPSYVVFLAVSCPNHCFIFMAFSLCMCLCPNCPFQGPLSC
jgi:hypothetical protein